MIRSMYIQSGELVIILKGRWKTKNHFFKSLRFRMVLLLILVSSIPCLILKTLIINGYEKRSVAWRTSEIQNQSAIIVNQINGTSYLTEPISEMLNAELVQLSNIYDGRVMVIDRDFRIKKDTFGMEEGKTIISSDVFQCFSGTTTNHYNEKGRYIEVTTPITEEIEGESEIVGVLLVSISTDIIEETMNSLNRVADTVFGLVMLIVAVLGYFFAGKMVRPFGKITDAIEAVTEGYEGGELKESSYTETENISEAFNKMLGRMKVLDDSRQEFVSNVSHELKTPLTSMKVLADSLLSQEGVPAELYKEFMTDIAQEIDRENEIINNLLSLVKMDKTASSLDIKSENVNEMVERILKRLQPIAAKKNVEVVFESFRPVVAEIDELKLSLSISNLVENAIKYNHEEGWVNVSLNADHKYFYLKVADSGMGIPEADQEHIFERFYRVDKSHSKEIDGTGLGLAIARNAVVMHRGSIKVHSEEGVGTTFTIRVPLNYIS